MCPSDKMFHLINIFFSNNINHILNVNVLFTYFFQFNIPLTILHTKGKPEAVSQKMTDSSMVKRKKRTKG
jgi:hypothetical protein